MSKSEPLTFKRLCDAAVTAGEMSKGTSAYFYGLYLNSDEHRDLTNLKSELLDLYGGKRVILPANAKHAKEMGRIAISYLKRA